MPLSFLEFVVGVLLMTLHLTYVIKKLSRAGVPRTLLYLVNVAIEVVAIHLVIDPVIPGHGVLQVHASWPTQYSHDNIIVEMAPIEFNGHVDLARLHTGSLTADGSYSVLMQFEWGEQRVYYRAYNAARPDSPFDEGFTSVSPYVRLGLLEKHIFLRHPE